MFKHFYRRDTIEAPSKNVLCQVFFILLISKHSEHLGKGKIMLTIPTHEIRINLF